MYKVKLDGKYLYHPWDKDLTIAEGKLTQELGKNGSFDFSISYTHPLAGAIQRRRSIVEVIRFSTSGTEETLYRGCCMNDTGNKGFELEVQTEGDLVFLSDSIVRPYGTVDTINRTPAEQFSWLISTHNAQVDDFKRFSVRSVNVQGESKRWSQTGYNSVREGVDGLIGEYGGYIRTQTVGDVTYIDWIASCDDISGQDIRQGSNIIDITKHIKTDDLATRIIPVGKDSNDGLPLTIKDENGGIDYIQDDAAVQEFGVITKVVEFSDITDKRKLKEAGEKYLETVKGALYTVELTAVDLSDAGIDIDSIDIGDMVLCEAPAYGISAVMQITKKATDILKPANCKVTLGTSMLTYTQTQAKNAAAFAPMVKTAVKNMQEQVDGIRQEIPSYSRITNIEIDEICK